MKRNIKIIFLILRIVSLTLSTCPSKNTIPNFEAGTFVYYLASVSFELTPDSSSNGYTNSIYGYSPKTQFTQKPNVALGTL